MSAQGDLIRAAGMLAVITLTVKTATSDYPEIMDELQAATNCMDEASMHIEKALTFRTPEDKQ